jgi:hypothetical protein
MTRRYTRWAVTLAALLEAGIFVLSGLNVIGAATTISCGFAVGAVLIASVMLHPVASANDETTGQDRPHS